MTLRTVLADLLTQSGSTIRLQHGLALAYRQADGQHQLALSRLDIYPGEPEIEIVKSVLSSLGFDPATIQRKMSTHVSRGHEHKLIRLCWPVAEQLGLPEVESASS